MPSTHPPPSHPPKCHPPEKNYKGKKAKKEERRKERRRRENFLDVNLMFLEIKIYFFVVCSCETSSLTSTFRHPGNGTGFCKEHEIF